ncbi:Uncharacterised protein [Yersinia massiliensis]|nr:Uncharacterised protein [Yersinia massiliensis]
MLLQQAEGHRRHTVSRVCQRGIDKLDNLTSGTFFNGLLHNIGFI